MGTTELKVKLMSLAAEAKIIRREEQRAKRGYRWAKLERNFLLQENEARDGEKVKEVEEKGRQYTSTFWSLRNHRKGVVAEAARSALLAYGFLRGRPYSALESRRTARGKEWNDAISSARSDASRFGGALFDEEKWKAWVKEAETWLSNKEVPRAPAEEKELLVSAG